MIYDKKAYLRGLMDTYSEEVKGGLDFWADHGVDWEKGGIVIYLDRQGNWYLDEKQGWFTGRGMFSFAAGYNYIEKRQRWLDAALNLYDFMVAHQFIFPDEGKLYHYMDREGNPCSPDPQAGEHQSRGGSWYNGYTDECFGVMGLAELYKATGRADVKATLDRVFDCMIKIYRHPQYFADGTLTEGDKAPKQGLGGLMCLLCATQTARECDKSREAEYTALLAEFVDQVFTYYYDPERPLLTEKIVDCPGHSMEVAWFCLAEGLYTKDQALVDKCAAVIKVLYDLGWDKQYGGFKVFANINDGAAFEINQDLKYWWPNNELEIGLMYSYIGTGDDWFLEHYRLVHEWVFGHFPDREYGEWYGYLHHDGTPLSFTKGDNQKGPFHLYRSFYAIHNLIKAYLEADPE